MSLPRKNKKRTSKPLPVRIAVRPSSLPRRESFFFEGNTGIGGLGCFSCGAKGADNFVMDRDRIVEDVADIDDYFEYERPLDFISRAERRALLKEAGGDEEKANQLLVERSNAPASDESQAQAEAAVNGGQVGSKDEPEVVAEEGEKKDVQSPPEESKTELKAETQTEKVEADTEITTTPSPAAKKETPDEVVKPAKSAKKKPPSSDDNMDLLGMDEF